MHIVSREVLWIKLVKAQGKSFKRKKVNYCWLYVIEWFKIDVTFYISKLDVISSVSWSHTPNKISVICTQAAYHDVTKKIKSSGLPPLTTARCSLTLPRWNLIRDRSSLYRLVVLDLIHFCPKFIWLILNSA